MFAYDDQGQRLVKYVKNNSANTAKTTWYINQYYQLTNDVLVTKHIFNGSQRVLTKHAGGSIVFRSKPRNTRSSEGRPKNDIPGNGKADALKDKKGQQNGNPSAPGYVKKNEPNQPNGNANGQAINQQGNGNSNNGNGNGNQQNGTHPGQGLENRSDRANEVAQNVYKNPNLQYLRDDPNSPYYQGDQGGQGTDENGQPIGNCDEINAGCTAGDEELAEYTGDEVVIIGSTKESLFYYHPDHLGSASVITDGEGILREHLEYFAFGETWVQEGASKKTPYLYTGKEFDQETGLYYYGARYYDPRTSVWQSVDPILEKYLDGEINTGIYNSFNLSVQSYSYQNPVKYTDPDGNFVHIAFGAAIGAAFGAATYALTTDDFSWSGLAIQTGTGAAVGAVTAAVPGAIAAGALNFGGKVANTAASLGNAAAAGSAGSVASQKFQGNDVDYGEALISGGANMIGFGVGKALAGPAGKLATVTTPGNPGLPVTSLKGNLFMIGRVESTQHVSEFTQQTIQDVAGALVSNAMDQALNEIKD